MKILFYTDTPKYGGAEIQMFLLAKFLNKDEFTPILAVSNYKTLDKWCENFEKEGIKVYRLNVKHKHDPRHYTQLKKIIKQERVDILHIHVWNPASNRYGFFAGKSMKIPIVITEHDPFELPFLKNLFKKIILKKVSKIITVSNENKKLLSNLYPKHKDKIEIIHNGIDITWWQSQTLRFTNDDIKKIKKEIFIANEDTLIITTIAELHERKGLKYLINAIATVSKKFHNIKLIIIGEGDDRQNLEKLIKNLKIEDHVILLGKRKDIPQLLKSSNIFVLPSVREAFGLVNLEAMVTPLPVISTKTGGIPEIIQNNRTGILVKPTNIEHLQEALIKLIQNSELRNNMAIEGFKRVNEKFTATQMAKEYEKIYKNLF